MCGPDVCVIGPCPAWTLAPGFALCGTLLHAVPQVGELPSGPPGGNVGGQRVPAIPAEAGAKGELWRVEGVYGQRMGGVGERRSVVVVVLLVQRVVAGGMGLLLLEVADLMGGLRVEHVAGRGGRVALELVLTVVLQLVVAGRQVELVVAGRVEQVTGRRRGQLEGG